LDGILVKKQTAIWITGCIAISIAACVTHLYVLYLWQQGAAQ